jgi:hypothetical protein
MEVAGHRRRAGLKRPGCTSRPSRWMSAQKPARPRPAPLPRCRRATRCCSALWMACARARPRPPTPTPTRRGATPSSRYECASRRGASCRRAAARRRAAPRCPGGGGARALRVAAPAAQARRPQRGRCRPGCCKRRECDAHAVWQQAIEQRTAVPVCVPPLPAGWVVAARLPLELAPPIAVGPGRARGRRRRRRRRRRDRGRRAGAGRRGEPADDRRRRRRRVPRIRRGDPRGKAPHRRPGRQRARRQERRPGRAAARGVQHQPGAARARPRHRRAGRQAQARGVLARRGPRQARAAPGIGSGGGRLGASQGTTAALGPSALPRV